MDLAPQHDQDSRLDIEATGRSRDYQPDLIFDAYQSVDPR
jgi:hypothetical protein